MSDTITIKLTSKVKAAAKRLERYYRALRDDSLSLPLRYSKSRYNTLVNDLDRLANAVLRARKGGAG